jgi:hypothetical protein
MRYPFDVRKFWSAATSVPDEPWESGWVKARAKAERGNNKIVRITAALFMIEKIVASNLLHTLYIQSACG